MTKLCLLAAAILFALGLTTDAFIVSSNAGSRRSSSLTMTALTANGKKIDFKEGSSLKAACAKLGVKPKYSCQK